MSKSDSTIHRVAQQSAYEYEVEKNTLCCWASKLCSSIIIVRIVNKNYYGCHMFGPNVTVGNMAEGGHGPAPKKYKFVHVRDYQYGVSVVENTARTTGCQMTLNLICTACPLVISKTVMGGGQRSRQKNRY